MQKRTLGCSTLEVSALGAADIELTADDLREIEVAAAKITLHGARYPAHLQQRVGR